MSNGSRDGFVMISRALSHLSSYLFCAEDLSTTSHRFDANTAAAVHPPSLANARRRMIAQQELDSCWALLFVDMQAHTHFSSGALAQLHVCSTRRADFAYSSTPRLQVRIGGCSPHARSLTPAGVLILRVRGIKRGATAVRLSPGMSVQPDIPFCVLALPPWSAKARRKLFCSCRRSNLCM